MVMPVGLEERESLLLTAVPELAAVGPKISGRGGGAIELIIINGGGGGPIVPMITLAG
jgi:hypothetical protein